LIIAHWLHRIIHTSCHAEQHNKYRHAGQV